MLQPLACPVCSRQEIPPGESTCPGCHTDLRPLIALAELPRVFFNQALACQAAGDAMGAIQAAAGAQVLDPECCAASVLLGKLFWTRGDADQARACWEAVAETAPEYTEARRLLAAAQRLAGPPPAGDEPSPLPPSAAPAVGNPSPANGSPDRSAG